MGSDRGDAEGDGRVPPLGVPEYSRYIRSEIQGGGMGVVIGDGGLGVGGAVANK